MQGSRPTHTSIKVDVHRPFKGTAMLPDAPKLMKRAERAAKTVKHGSEILTLMKTPTMRGLLVEGVNEGIPPISKISQLLVKGFPVEDLRTVPVKTSIGLFARAVLAYEDCERVERGVRTNRSTDPLFTSGSVYRHVEPLPDGDADVHDELELVALIEAVSARMLGASSRRVLIQRLAEINA